MIIITLITILLAIYFCITAFLLVVCIIYWVGHKEFNLSHLGFVFGWPIYFIMQIIGPHLHN
jgi:hypothetical protein